MALFPQFPYSNLHELNLDWIIEQIRQIEGEGVVLSVNGLSGVVTLYTDKDVVFPDLNYNDHWQIFREIDNKIAGLKFTGEKFFYITKNEGDEEFTVQEVYTSGNQPPYPVRSVNGQTGDVTISVPVTSVNGRTGNVMLAGDNIPYNIDGTYTIEDIITPIEKSIGHVIRYNTCAEGVSAGQYVYLILSGISGRSDGLYRAVNAKSAGTVWTSADLAPVAGGLGALMASNDSAIATLNGKLTTTTYDVTNSSNQVVCKLFKNNKTVTLIIMAGNWHCDTAYSNILDANGSSITIPAEYRPSFAVSMYDKFSNARIYVEMNGTITSDSVFASTAVRFTTTYVIA